MSVFNLDYSCMFDMLIDIMVTFVMIAEFSKWKCYGRPIDQCYFSCCCFFNFTKSFELQVFQLRLNFSYRYVI